MPESVPPFVKMMVADKAKRQGLPLVTDVMDDDVYDQTWVRSIARKGRSDAEMKALHPDLEAYRLGEDSDLISYHKKPAQPPATS